MMDDMFSHLIFEPFRALNPAPLRYMHRGMDILEDDIVDHCRDNEKPDKEGASEEMTDSPSNCPRNERHGDEHPVRYGNTFSVFCILKSFFTRVELMVVDMAFPLTDKYTDLPMFERSMDDPFQERIEEYARKNCAEDEEKRGHRGRILRDG